MMAVNPWPSWVFFAFPLLLAYVICWGIQVRCFDDEERPNLVVVLTLAVLGLGLQHHFEHFSSFYSVVVLGYLAWGLGRGGWRRHCEKQAWLRVAGPRAKSARWWR